MTFDELWARVWKEARLPNEAKELLPQSLSEMTKQGLLTSGKSPSEIARIVEIAVDAINHGAIESLVYRLNDFCSYDC